MRSRLLFLALAASLSAPSLVGCAADDATDDPATNVEVTKSATARNDAPTLAAGEGETFAKDQASFAIDLYHSVRKQPGVSGNVFLSPHSVSTALAMTYAGARGQTKTEMKAALHFSLADERLHNAFNYLDSQLESRGKGAKATDGTPFKLSVANSLWGQKDFAIEAPFLDTLALNYGAGMNRVDFVGETEKARTTINGWVEDKTEDRIKELLKPGIVTADTRLVLVNAIYFNASWANKFEPSETKDAPFTTADGTQVNVPTMHQNDMMPYVAGDGFQAAAIPYDGNEMELLVIAPTKGTFASFEASLTGESVLGIMAGLQQTQVKLAFPKLKTEGAFELKQPLEALGMKAAFGDAADFTGIAPGLSISEVVHKTFLALDEKGTEAAAATAVVMRESSAPADPVVMNLDRPFIMAVVDKATKTLAFVGRIDNPSK